MDDGHIIERFRRGEERGFKGVYDMFYLQLSYFAYSVIKDSAEAKDIAIISLEKAFEKPRQFESIEKLKAYLFITVKNKCLKYIDTEKRHRNSHNEIMCITENNHEDYIEAQIVRSEFLMEIYKEIQHLPPIRRKVFEMLFIDNLSHAQVAIALNMNKATVLVNKSKALRDLRLKIFK